MSFQYFVDLEWRYFTLAIITYLTVWMLSHWKEFFNLNG